MISESYSKILTTVHLDKIQIIYSCEFCIAFQWQHPTWNYNIMKVMNHETLCKQKTNKWYMREI